jgi:fumarylacetoacetase
MASSDGFGIDHLPYGVFTRARPGDAPRAGVRFGDGVLDLAAADTGVDPSVWTSGSLNAFLALGREAWSGVRAAARAAIEAGAELVPLGEVRLRRPVDPPDYVDFYSSIEHASNVGRMFRPDGDPLLPNWRWLPVGYHGRSASVVVSGTPVRRPNGQLPGDPPRFGPSRRLDFELELGFVTGTGPPLGEPLPISRVGEVIFGVALVNDWSARDIQRWEYQPLGPFLAKSFATSMAAWVTPLEALEHARVPAREQDPAPMEYLRTDERWALDVDLEVQLNGTVVSRTNARGLYWNMAQQLAHATVNGANVRAGDLYASGTISGPEPGTYGSLLELTWGGRDPIAMDGGGERTFLEDGDAVVMRGTAGGVTLGEVGGSIEPAPVT